jgi:CheY-like chemotaxis protein
MKAEARRALLANDDLFSSARLLSVLRAMGFQTLAATNPADVLRMARQERFDLALINLGSERMQGLDLVRALKRCGSPPLILAFVPHVRLSEVKDAAVQAGVNRICVNSAVHKRLPEIVNGMLSGTLSEVDERDT